MAEVAGGKKGDGMPEKVDITREQRELLGKLADMLCESKQSGACEAFQQEFEVPECKDYICEGTCCDDCPAWGGNFDKTIEALKEVARG